MTDEADPKPFKKRETKTRATPSRTGKSRLSESYFFNSALYYLQRYNSTEANLRQVLGRKVFRAKQRGEDIPPDTAEWIAKAVEKCLKLGYVNDRVFAESKAVSMRREGRSTRYIMQNLQQKGVPQPLIAAIMQELAPDHDDINPELESAQRTIRRRNMVRADKLAMLDTEERREHYQKNLAKLMRAGFPLHIARQALDPLYQKS